ncbi:MAG: hypothetical protein ACRCYY_08550 [Trueperaceae bacterium]
MPKVLLLHTETPLFDLLKSKLEQGGFEVLEANNDVPPDLIIVGNSPEQSLLLSEETNTPVIVLGSAEGDEQANLSQLKMPFRPSELVELVRKTLSPQPVVLR